MLTIEKIFSLSKKELKLQLIEFNDEEKYSNILELRNAVIIQAFNNNQLNENDEKIVSNDKFDLIMKTNPKTYIDFLDKLDNKISSKKQISKFTRKINIDVNPENLKSWNYVKIIKTIDYDNQHLFRSMTSNSKYLFVHLINNNNNRKIINRKISIYDFKFELIHNIDVKYDYVSKDDTFIEIFCNENYLFIAYVSNHKNSIKIFDINNFNEIKIIELKNRFKMCFNKNFLYVGFSYNKKTLIYSLQTFKIIKTIEISHDIYDLTIVNDNYLFKQFDGDKIKIIDLETFKEKKILNTNEYIAFMILNDKFLITLGYKNYIFYINLIVNFWDIQTFNLVKTIELTNESYPININKNYLFIGEFNIEVYNLNDFNLIKTIKISDFDDEDTNDILVNDENLFIYNHSVDKLNIYEKD
jgi:hypothetical protein